MKNQKKRERTKKKTLKIKSKTDFSLVDNRCVVWCRCVRTHSTSLVRFVWCEFIRVWVLSVHKVNGVLARYRFIWIENKIEANQMKWNVVFFFVCQKKYENEKNKIVLANVAGKHNLSSRFVSVSLCAHNLIYFFRSCWFSPLTAKTRFQISNQKENVFIFHFIWFHRTHKSKMVEKPITDRNEKSRKNNLKLHCWGTSCSIDL